MQQQTDHELLREYALHRSEPAFGEIVRRYADLVYSVALRHLGNEAQARDVAQTVFVDLARKAGSLRAGTTLVGWLHRAARLAALEQIRADDRRARRERQAMQLLENPENADDNWTAICPKLDEAIASLGNEDRDALLLRFFKNESLAAVGAALGISEDAAQKRVARALERMREWLASRGIRTTAGALAAALAANAVHAAPAGWVTSIASGALAGSTGIASSTWSSFLFTPTKAAIALVALAGGLAFMTFSKAQMQRELNATQSRLNDRSTELATLLEAENQRRAGLEEELERARADASEILRLRAEVARLRREQAERLASTVENNPRAEEVPASPSQVVLQAKVISGPASVLPGVSTTGLLSPEQLETIVQSLGLDRDPDLLAAKGLKTSNLQVTTLSGRQAQLQSLSDGQRGICLDIIASAATNARVLVEGMWASPPIAFDADELPGSPQDERFRVHLPTSAPAEIVVLVTNAISVPDGWSLLMSRRIPEMGKWQSAGEERREPEALLVVLTPTIIDPAGNRVYTTPSREEVTISDVNAFPGQVDAQASSMEFRL